VIKLLYRRGVLVLCLLTASAGCHRKNAVGIDVDVYLHPEAADSEDLLLQTAIQKQFDENPAIRDKLIHVRVVDRIVFLSGTVESQKEKEAAEGIARNTSVAVNGVTIKASESVRSSITVEQ
jgi:BON domain-containing protein